MAKDINPLKSYSDKKAKEFNEGVKSGGVEYLVKMNEELNTIVKQKGLKTKDYKIVRKEQYNGNKDKE